MSADFSQTVVCNAAGCPYRTAVGFCCNPVLDISNGQCKEMIRVWKDKSIDSSNKGEVKIVDAEEVTPCDAIVVHCRNQEI